MEVVILLFSGALVSGVCVCLQQNCNNLKMAAIGRKI